MKKIILNLIAVSAVALPLVAMAAFNPGGTPNPPTDINAIVDAILNFVWIVFVAIATIAILFAGVLFLTSQGDPEKVKTARTAFLWGIAGIVVAIIAFSIVLIVRNTIGG